ncbi:MAG TPA: lytic murein transglycosylase [Pseudolabrys sp.]|jgi:lytic murein transglycosylase|nr:lytic murein transglycosylase [Pseudolabrys sp.]
MFRRAFAALSFSLLLVAPAAAAQCGGSFPSFLAGMARDAEAQGISARTVNAAFSGLTPDRQVMAFDRRQQHSFGGHESFEHFARTRVTAARLHRAARLMRRHAALLKRIEARFGVPKELLMAIWTMETDNGVGDMGHKPVVRTLATLAHNCRRSQLFQGELISALRILQRGDLPPSQMIGAYAGEIGQTQFLPSSYIKYGVDFDGDGHVDLRHSVADVLASTANLLRQNGWHPGQPYGEGTANFDVMREWNRSEVYRRALVLFAHKLAGGEE